MLTFETEFDGTVYKAVVFEGKVKVDEIKRPCLAKLRRDVLSCYPKAKEKTVK